MRIVRVAIAGFGNVGRATARLLLARRERYARLYGAEVRLVAVCGSHAGAEDANGLMTEQLDSLQTGSVGPDFIFSSAPDVLIEAGPSDFRTGGPGLEYLRIALRDGRDAIVISKGALVRDGRELRELASASGASLRISGAAGAALPTIDLLRHSLAGCEVLLVEGILNATTNYLLDAMMNRGATLAAALDEARTGGFAERDARNDVEGWDTACKMLLVANFGLGAELSIDDISVQGIQDVTERDVVRWREEQVVPRLVGSLTRESGAIRAAVALRTYREDDPFALVSGKNKAVRVITDQMGELVAIGGGSEPGATAAAALKDLEHVLMARSSISTANGA